MTDYKLILRQPSKRTLLIRDLIALAVFIFLFWWAGNCFLAALDYEPVPYYPAKVRCE